MEMIGLDLHKRESQLAIKAEDGLPGRKQDVGPRQVAAPEDRPRGRRNEPRARGTGGWCCIYPLMTVNC